MPAAFSYLRFSSQQQSVGDSLRRQTQARDAWLAARPQVSLDTSLVMTDAGRSAYKRKDWDTYALAQFVEHVKSGRVSKGSYLLMENLDRLSRESAGEATELFLSVVNRGIVVVQLLPVAMEFKRPVDMMSLMFAVLELSRGHSESAMKSERGRAAWGRKQREAATRVVTKKLPGWISYVDGRLVLNDHAATVRRMFRLANDGKGTAAIAATFNAESVPVLGRKTIRGRSVMWAGATVWHILTSRAAIGEYTPYRRRGITALSPVQDYFPPVVDRATFSTARAAIAARGRVGRGRRGKHLNLFSGLLKDARDGGTLTYWVNGGHPAVLIPVNAKEGRGTAWVSFPARPFEEALLSLLREVTVKDIEGESAGPAAATLATDLHELDALIAKWATKMDDPAILDVVAEKLTELHTKRRAVAQDLAAAEREATTPVAAVWREYGSLADLLAGDPSAETRTKVRNALRRCIASITCLIVGCKESRTKVMAARVQFVTGAHRNYVVTAHPGCRGACVREATWEATSFAAGGLPARGTDLRDPESARRLGSLLSKHLANAIRAKRQPSNGP